MRLVSNAVIVPVVCRGGMTLLLGARFVTAQIQLEPFGEVMRAQGSLDSSIFPDADLLTHLLHESLLQAAAVVFCGLPLSV